MLIADIGHIAFRVPDVDVSVDYVTNVLGMIEVERVGDTAYVSQGSPYPSVWPSLNHHIMEFIGGSEGPEFDHIGLIAQDADALAQIRANAIDIGATIDESVTSEPGIAEMLRIVTPTGHVIDTYVEMEQVERDYQPKGVLTHRLAHAFMWTQDVKGLAEFLVAVFKFKPSDWIGTPEDPYIGFLRCHLEHHTLAIGRGPIEGVYHYALEVPGTADLGRLGDQLSRSGYGYLWGLGRHGGGDNIASYHVSPDGLLVEVYADMQKIAGDGWKPRHWNVEDPRGGNLWGEMPGDFSKLMAPHAPIAKR